MGGAQCLFVRITKRKRLMRGARLKPIVVKIFVLYITVQGREGGRAVNGAVFDELAAYLVM
jgi:hypothetical protein